MPITTYDKLTIAESLPAELTKVIWLDCDMLVLADLAELWDSPIGDSHLLAVRDALVPDVSSRFGISGFAEIGLEASTAYFNAGMMVIDLIKWRASGIAAAALKYLKRFQGRVFFWDQEALNAVLAGRWTSIDDKWNRSATLDRLSRRDSHSTAADNGQRIIHFNGNIKPWLVREKSEIDASYFKTLDETSWRGWRPEQTITRTLLGWYGSSPVRRLFYPAEQVGMQLVWRLTQRQA
jgi:lipopolysaccharide biosynthesis glycosyltransferase